MRKPTVILLLLTLCLSFFTSCEPDESGTISVLTAALLDEMEESLLNRVNTVGDSPRSSSRVLKSGDTTPDSLLPT